jgi:hypothetical protein
MMEAVSTSETSVNFYQTTRRNIPENSHLHTPRRENLQSHHEVSLSSCVLCPEHMYISLQVLREHWQSRLVGLVWRHTLSGCGHTDSRV